MACDFSAVIMYRVVPDHHIVVNILLGNDPPQFCSLFQLAVAADDFRSPGKRGQLCFDIFVYIKSDGF